MKIYCFNVNGLRSFSESIGMDFNEFLLHQDAEIFCFQEIKGSRSNLSKYFSLKDFYTFASFHHKSGRHGVATLVKKTCYCNKFEEIVPGRILKTHHGNFSLYNCYMPYTATDEPDESVMLVYEMLQSSVISSHTDRNQHCSKNPATNVTGSFRTIVCGDFNATYNMLDSYLYKKELEKLINVDTWFQNDCKLNCASYAQYSYEKIDNMQNHNSSTLYEPEFYKKLLILAEGSDKVGKINPKQTELPYYFLNIASLEKFYLRREQRVWFRDFIKYFQDSYRTHNNKLDKYTCWDQHLRLRELNLGTRIDYILNSFDIECWGGEIHDNVQGSDHCPITAEFKIETYENESDNLVKVKNNLLDFFKKKP